MPASAPRALALTADGGRTWTLVGAGAAPGEYRSGATWIPHTRGTALAVGLTGSDISTDGGLDWRRFDSGSFDAVVCTPGGSCWASGADERIGRLVAALTQGEGYILGINAAPAPTVLHLSLIVGGVLRDRNGERLGKVDDLLVRLGEDYPPVTGVLASVAGRPVFVPLGPGRPRSPTAGSTCTPRRSTCSGSSAAPARCC